MAEFDFRDFYIGYEGHPKFTINKIIVDDIIRVIIQKYEMLIFTNKGDVLGDPNLGCDLVNLLHQTKISSFAVKNIIIEQINTYIQELKDTNYSLEVIFQEDPNNYQNIMIINFTLSEYEVSAIII